MGDRGFYQSGSKCKYENSENQWSCEPKLELKINVTNKESLASQERSTAFGSKNRKRSLRLLLSLSRGQSSACSRNNLAPSMCNWMVNKGPLTKTIGEWVGGAGQSRWKWSENRHRRSRVRPRGSLVSLTCLLLSIPSYEYKHLFI